MADPFRKYHGLTYREIGWRLRYQEMPEEMIEQTLAAIKEHRRNLATAKRQAQERDKQWGEVISSLQHERKIVRSMLRYKTKEPAPERDSFLAAYMEALNLLFEKLYAKKRLGKELPAHSHWTDYVPERVKQAFIEEADFVPPRQKARFKAPFRKADPTKLRDLRHGRLLRHIHKHLETTSARLEIEPENQRYIRQEHLLRRALARTKQLPNDAHVPNHWKDMVSDLMVQEDNDE